MEATSPGRRLARGFQANCPGVEQAELANLFYKFVEMNREITTSAAQVGATGMLWNMCDAKGRGDDFYGPANEQKIVNRNVRVGGS